MRLLYDGMGNSRLPKDFFDKLHAAGGYTAAFLPPFIVRINYRNHRKLCIIDGKVGYIGGFNVGDEYLGIVKRYGPWRDTHLRVVGDAIDQMQMRFIKDWNFTTRYGAVKLEQRYFPLREQSEGIRMQIVSSGPDTKWHNVHNGYFKMINEAEHHIYLTTPYFVPDDGIFEALRVAALSGLDVRILIPGNPDHFFVYWASMSYLGQLLEAGVRCYQYEKGFIHSKSLCIDGKMSSVGTANMDIRSFDLNFEVNAFLYDAAFTRELEQDFLNDLKSSVEITREWYNRKKMVVQGERSCGKAHFSYAVRTAGKEGFLWNAKDTRKNRPSIIIRWIRKEHFLRRHCCLPCKTRPLTTQIHWATLWTIWQSFSAAGRLSTGISWYIVCLLIGKPSAWKHGATNAGRCRRKEDISSLTKREKRLQTVCPAGFTWILQSANPPMCPMI
ncbi:MAG: cardiolipin synthase [Anaerotignum sp.]